MAKRTTRLICNVADLEACEAQIDQAICGTTLLDERESRFAKEGAHDAAPTYYYILEKLFRHYKLTDESHLLDVGCSTGRVLAHFVRAGYPGRATGVELDPQLAAAAQAWTARYPNVDVLNENALELDLNQYTDFYLFNPFSPGVLQQFIEAIEYELQHPCTLIHMSDNGDTWHYVGRPGWTELSSGEMQYYRNARGYQIKVFEWPQHYTVWRFDGNA